MFIYLGSIASADIIAMVALLQSNQNHIGNDRNCGRSVTKLTGASPQDKYGELEIFEGLKIT
jgi:hypothetical protein